MKKASPYIFIVCIWLFLLHLLNLNSINKFYEKSSDQRANPFERLVYSCQHKLIHQSHCDSEDLKFHASNVGELSYELIPESVSKKPSIENQIYCQKILKQAMTNNAIYQYKFAELNNSGTCDNTFKSIDWFQKAKDNSHPLTIKDKS
jgi:hypothetical protein